MKIKIECTQKQKKLFIQTILYGEQYSEFGCFFPNEIKCEYETIGCEGCLEKNIEWVIVNDVYEDEPKPEPQKIKTECEKCVHYKGYGEIGTACRRQNPCEIWYCRNKSEFKQRRTKK